MSRAGNIKILILLMAPACQTAYHELETASPDHIIFGHFYGECAGEQCVEIYKLTANSLYEDIKDEYPSFHKAYDGSFLLLDDSLFEKVNGLRNEIPIGLLKVNPTVIGQPDAGDWGGIYFEIINDGERKYWLIDRKEANIPEGLRAFVGTIGNKIAQINN